MNASILMILLAASQPYDLSESCQILYNGPDGQWSFVKVYDAESGKEVLSTAVKAGRPKSLFSAPRRIRLESKLAGATKYSPGPTGDCAKGKVVAF